LSLSRRTVVARGCATIAASTTGWLTLARGSAAPPAIEHLVVIYGENESFDHYFAGYPAAANDRGDEPAFTAKVGTPQVENLVKANLLVGNPNAADPKRIARANALTCDQDHSYGNEQKAFNNGAMNKFVEFTAGGSCAGARGRNIVMDYFDGNTVTALWNLAQSFTLADAFYSSTFGPSTPGALNLIAGTTYGAGPAGSGIEHGSMTGDPDPAFDDCASGGTSMSGKNIGDLLNAAHVTWGWFQGGFRPTAVVAGRAVCATAHPNIGGGLVPDYNAHHQPFMYYASTANPHHAPPSSVAAIGHDDQANHQYDLLDFDAAVQAGNLPAVSFLKAASFEDAHPGYSDPLDEQHFIARTLDELQQSPQWETTAVVIAYDDSDGWYDHMQAVSQKSNSDSDAAICRTVAQVPPEYMARCGPGPRLPLLVVSPWVKVNAVYSQQLEQASVIRYVEEHWNLATLPPEQKSFDTRARSLGDVFDFNNGAAPKVWLDPASGTVLQAPPAGLVSSPGIPPLPPAVPAVSPTPTPAPQPAKKPAIKPRLAVAAKRSGRKLTLSLRVSGVSARNGRITLSVKLRRNRRTLAASRTATVRSGRVKLVLKAKKRLKRGRYTLTVTVRQGAAKATVTKRLTVR
jgi:phospholipase C